MGQSRKVLRSDGGLADTKGAKEDFASAPEDAFCHRAISFHPPKRLGGGHLAAGRQRAGHGPGLSSSVRHLE
ncbi:MAG: hypothetical protein HWE23_00610 [Rhodobacteraceae bacterium]|nr:hypothetical protein [Paracoccaceae bacterium]